MYSVVILTYNEEINIKECIESIKYSNDIVIIDSYSTDDTVSIAKNYSVRVYNRIFDNYASQRNYVLNEIDFKNKWILMLDADERLTEGFEQELLLKLNFIDEKVAMLRFRRKDFFLNKWIKRSSGYPTWFGRVIKRGSVKVERDINEEYITEGEVDYLKEHILHYPFNRGIKYWFEKHNKYSSMEAEYLISGLIEKKINYKDLISTDPVVRRKMLKKIFYRLPLRSSLVFIYLYFFRLGILDGYPGYLFCKLRALYEYMITIKMKGNLIQRKNNSLNNNQEE